MHKFLYQCSYAKYLLWMVDHQISNNIYFHIFVAKYSNSAWNISMFGEQGISKQITGEYINLQEAIITFAASDIGNDIRFETFLSSPYYKLALSDIEALINSDRLKTFIPFVVVERDRVLFYTYSIDVRFMRSVKSANKYFVCFTKTILQFVSKLSVKRKKSETKNDIVNIYERITQKLMDGFSLPSPQIMNMLSILTYESEECKGNLVVLDTNEKKTQEFLSKHGILFLNPVEVKLDNLRHLRKYIEMSDDSFALVISKKGHVFGLVCTEKITFPFIQIIIQGYMSWTVMYLGQELLSSSNGKYRFYNNQRNDTFFDIEKVIASIISPKGNGEKISNLSSLIKELSCQHHGTLLIITNDAESEADRLCDIGRGIKVKPFSLVDHFKSVNPISSIDGAIIIDEDGMCYAIGVILDGKAYNVGDTSRGARYNSAITFISNQITREKKWKNNPYIGVVISEDKTLDIVSFNEGEGTLYKESLKIR